MTEGELKRTPLYEEHVTAGGRLVPFAGWELPVQYSSLVDEHKAVRSAAGLFDVSHMGEIVVSGPGALDLVQLLSCNDHSKMKVGRAQYTGLMTRKGTFVDDMLVHRTDDDEYLLVVNAANVAKDLAWVEEVAATVDGASVEDRSDVTAQLAVQGPKALEILEPLTGVALGDIRYYRFTTGVIAGVEALIARTGYTGEDGFELYVAPDEAPGLWRKILAAGEGHGLVPAGLGARDTLRLEAGMALYGNDIDDETTPLEAGLGWIVKLDKGEFLGRDVLRRQKEEGVDRLLVGLKMEGRGIPRHGYDLHGDADGPAIGRVTSGTHSPTLAEPVAMGYLPPDEAEVGTPVFVDIRGRKVPARVVEMPFYSRKRKKNTSATGSGS